MSPYAGCSTRFVLSCHFNRREWSLSSSCFFISPPKMLQDIAAPPGNTRAAQDSAVSPPCVLILPTQRYFPGNSPLTASFQWLEEFPFSISSSAGTASGALLQMFEEIHQSPMPETQLLLNIFQLAPTASYGSPSLKLLRIKRAQNKLN